MDACLFAPRNSAIWSLRAIGATTNLDVLCTLRPIRVYLFRLLHATAVLYSISKFGEKQIDSRKFIAGA